MYGKLFHVVICGLILIATANVWGAGEMVIDHSDQVNKTLAGKLDGQVAMMTEIYDAEPNTAYRLSVDIKSMADSGEISLAVREMEEAGTKRPDLAYGRPVRLQAKNSSGYKTYGNLFFTTQKTEKFAVVYILRNLDGKVSFRNLTVKKIDRKEVSREFRQKGVTEVYFSLPVFAWADETALRWGYHVNADKILEANEIDRLDLVLEKDGNSLYRSEIHSPAMSVESVAVMPVSLEPGVYTLTAVAYNRENREVTRKNSTFRVVKRIAMRSFYPVENVRIDAEKHLFVNGNPFFMRSIWITHTLKDFITCREQGFNSVQVWAPTVPEVLASLDEAAKAKMPTWLITKAEKVEDAYLAELVGKIRNHPTVLMYYSVDEPNLDYRGLISRELVDRKNDVIRKADPDKPVFLSFGGGSQDVERFRELNCDIVAFHSYPFPDGEITIFSRDMEGLKSVFGRDKVYFVTPQAWVDPTSLSRKEQTAAQTRAEVYLSIIHGARGICYYTFKDYTFDILKYPRLWSVLKQINYELEQLNDLLVLGTVSDKFELKPACIEGRVFSWRGETYLVSVNTSKESITGTFSLDAKPNFTAKRIFRPEMSELKSNHGTVELSYESEETLILKLTRDR